MHDGLTAAFYACAGFAFLALLISVTCLYGIGKVGHREKKQRPRDDEEGEETAVARERAREGEKV